MKNQITRGYTLIEIGIVLVIVSLLIGGILRGQELINSARARNIIDQKSSIQTAMLAFSNRYKAMPGDLTTAQRDFIGGGVLASASGAGNGTVTLATIGATNESALFFQNLAATSFLSCTACMTLTAGTSNDPSSSANSPTNVSASFLQFGTVAPSALGVSWLDGSATLPPARNVLITGAQISSSILQEVDIKTDDGAPNTGLFRQSTTSGADTTANCAPVPVPAITGVTNRWATPEQSNCAGAWLF